MSLLSAVVARSRLFRLAARASTRFLEKQNTTTGSRDLRHITTCASLTKTAHDQLLHVLRLPAACSAVCWDNLP